MEWIKSAIYRIASTSDCCISELSLLHRSLIPIFSFASNLYFFSILFRRRLYVGGIFRTHRFSVPVISVGNLTLGGNGKTPMVEFIANFLDEAGLSPLILTRGYSGGDEARMLRRHLSQGSVKIGVGSNRVLVGSNMLKRYGYVDYKNTIFREKRSRIEKVKSDSTDTKIAVVILDDGMQHLAISRDIEIVMINALRPWGNDHLLPRGTLREPRREITRADIVVVHHTDLVSDIELGNIQSNLKTSSSKFSIFYSRLTPSYFLEVNNFPTRMSVSAVRDKVVLCISAIGSPDAFVRGIKRLEPIHVDRFDFLDHHSIQFSDIELIKEKMKKLEDEFEGKTIIVVVTEKDYDRDPAVLEEMACLLTKQVFILCSSFHIMPFDGKTDEDFKSTERREHDNIIARHSPTL